MVIMLKQSCCFQNREYVLEYTGLKVSSLYIAQVKQRYGIIERKKLQLWKH